MEGATANQATTTTNSEVAVKVEEGTTGLPDSSDDELGEADMVLSSGSSTPIYQVPSAVPPPPPTPPSEQAFMDMIKEQAAAMDEELKSALASLNHDPAPLILTASETRKVRYRPGPAPKSSIMFRGVAITDSDSSVAHADARRHFELVKNDQQAIFCATASRRSDKFDFALSTVAFGSLVISTEQQLVSTKWTPCSSVPNEHEAELLAIRYAFEEGLMKVEDRESGADGFNFRRHGCKVKTFTVITPNSKAVRLIQEYEEARTQNWDRQGYKEEEIIRSIAELSSELAEKKIDVYLYSAPVHSIPPLSKAQASTAVQKEFGVPVLM